MKNSMSLRVAVYALTSMSALRAQTPPEPPPAPAAAPAAPTWSAGPINFSGLIDGYYSLNFNHPASMNNNLRNFDVKANQFSLNMAKITLDHDADPVGFKIDIGFGRAWEIFHATDPAGTDIVRYIPQAYLTYKPANAGGLTFDFGKFYTSAGAELTETHLNWNYSRSLVYANGPYYHFGARVTKPLSKTYTVGFQLINGWNNVEDNNSGKTMGFTSAYAGSKWGLFNNVYVGPEKTATNEGWRQFYDNVLTLTPNSAFNMYVNYDYGSDKHVGSGKDTFMGIAVAAKFQLNGKNAISPRYEFYSDRNGFITGQDQKIKEFTFTYEYKWLEGLLTRLEYRRDWSDKPFFDRGNELASSKNMSTLLIGFVAFFGPKR